MNKILNTRLVRLPFLLLFLLLGSTWGLGITARPAVADGGGLDSEGGLVTMNAVTVAGNAAAGGGGINVDPGTIIRLSATLIGDNTAGDTGPDLHGTLSAASYTLLEDGTGAAGITNGTDGNIVGVDGRLLPLADYGGPTLTHALTAASPAIDAARNTGLSTDQRGISRPQGGADDIGAFEAIIRLFLPLVLQH